VPRHANGETGFGFHCNTAGQVPAECACARNRDKQQMTPQLGHSHGHTLQLDACLKSKRVSLFH
jgi:hypothetical protein